jgi:hypothetical protein
MNPQMKKHTATDAYPTSVPTSATPTTRVASAGQRRENAFWSAAPTINADASAAIAVKALRTT